MAEEITDANSRLKARLRPSVPPRQTSLLKHQEVEPSAEPAQQTEETRPSSSQQSATSASTKPEKAFQLVAFTLRVEASVDKGLKSLCADEGITKETFLEAAYLVCQSNRQMMEQVVKMAEERRQQRKATGMRRRAKTMSRYLES